jgi:glycosyltransferase involved in cell wall biosynthesis
MVANFSAGKNHKVLLKAISEVKKRNIQIKCLLAGDGPLRKEIEDKTAELNLGDEIIFMGQRDDVNAIFSLFDIFVLPSSCEGFPNALLEAMACGLAVIATNAGGVPELVEKGRNGVLVKPGDDFELAAAIIKLCQSQDIRNNLGSYARKKMEDKFSLKRMTKEYEDFYKSLIVKKEF